MQTRGSQHRGRGKNAAGPSSEEKNPADETKEYLTSNQLLCSILPRRHAAEQRDRP